MREDGGEEGGESGGDRQGIDVVGDRERGIEAEEIVHGGGMWRPVEARDGEVEEPLGRRESEVVVVQKASSHFSGEANGFGKRIEFGALNFLFIVHGIRTLERITNSGMNRTETPSVLRSDGPKE